MKKIILTVLCVVLAMVMLTACGRQNVGDYTENHTQGNTSVTTGHSTTTSKATTSEDKTTGVLTPTTSGATSSQGSTSQPNNG